MHYMHAPSTLVPVRVTMRPTASVQELAATGAGWHCRSRSHMPTARTGTCKSLIDSSEVHHHTHWHKRS